MFITYFMMTTHVIACLWILTAKMDTNVEDSWIYSLDFENKTEIYMTSFYFTVTTITTVGYGDMSASTTLEQVVCVLFMIIGVIAFSMASGALTNYISSEDQKSAAYEEKMGVLEELQNKYKMPREMYIEIRRNIEHNFCSDYRTVSKFVHDLPL